MSSSDSASAPPLPNRSPREAAEGRAPRAIGRYLLFGEIASGGMASVHLGRLMGPVGFSRTVAIKRLHPHFERDPEFVAMFVDEARIAARIRHPNVVQTLDVVSTDDELFLVMDYVEGESLARLLRASARAGHAAPPVDVVLAIACGALSGLHAAHEAVGENGQPLNVVHRDVSPQNVLVGVDGTARVLDFGIAKAMGRLQTTRSGQWKGKLAYMAPEQLKTGEATRRTDVYGASVVLWEALTGSRLFVGDEAAVVGQVLGGKIEPPSSVEPSVPRALDAIVMRGLAADPEQRFATALELARALSQVGPVASALEVGDWVKAIAGAAIGERATLVASIEASGSLPAVLPALVPEPAGATRRIDKSAPAEGIAASDADTRLTWRGGTSRRISTKAAALSGIGVAVLAAGIVLGVLLVSKRQVEQTSVSASSPVLASAPPVTPAPPVSDSAAAEPASSASVAPPTPSVPVAARHAKAPRATATTHAEAPAQSKCNPPYYLDKDGFKVFKPGCLY